MRPARRMFFVGIKYHIPGIPEANNLSIFPKGGIASQFPEGGAGGVNSKKHPTTPKPCASTTAP